MSSAGGLLALAALFLTAGCAALRTSAPPEAQRLQARAAFERGVEHMRERQPAPALSALREAVALDPTSATYRNTLGLLYLELRRPDLAIEEFQRAVELDPRQADTHVNLGIALAETGRWSDAVTSYRTAISLPSLRSEAVAYQNLGLALYHLRLLREAEEALRFAIALEPRMEGAHYNLGLVLLSSGRREEARRAFLTVRELAPQGAFGQAAAERLRGLGDGG